MNTITLTNDFHGTRVALRVNGDSLTASQIRRAKKTLCGVAGCCCSGALGTRGTQTAHVELVGWGDNQVGVVHELDPMADFFKQ
jgi:hypothetical protein